MVLELKRIIEINFYLSTAEANTVRNLSKIINDLENLFDENNDDFFAFVDTCYSSISEFLEELANNPKELIDRCYKWLEWN